MPRVASLADSDHLSSRTMSALVGKKRASTAGKATKKRKAPAPAPTPVTPESVGNAGAPKNEVREDQVGRAVKALLDFQERKTATAGKKAFLGEDEENIQLVLTLQRIPQVSQHTLDHGRATTAATIAAIAAISTISTIATTPPPPPPAPPPQATHPPHPSPRPRAYSPTQP